MNPPCVYMGIRRLLTALVIKEDGAFSSSAGGGPISCVHLGFSLPCIASVLNRLPIFFLRACPVGDVVGDDGVLETHMADGEQVRPAQLT